MNIEKTITEIKIRHEEDLTDLDKPEFDWQQCFADREKLLKIVDLLLKEKKDAEYKEAVRNFGT